MINKLNSNLQRKKEKEDKQSSICKPTREDISEIFDTNQNGR